MRVIDPTLDGISDQRMQPTETGSEHTWGQAELGAVLYTSSECGRVVIVVLELFWVLDRLSSQSIKDPAVSLPPKMKTADQQTCVKRARFTLLT